MSIRIGIVGANAAAREIVDIIISIENARIVAICDREYSNAESLARRCKARAFRDVKAMLKPPTKRELLRRKNQNSESESESGEEPTKTLDAVCVFSIERNRSEAISLAMQSGCDIFVASPLAFTLDGAKQLLQSAQDNRARLWTSHAARFSPSCEHARKLLSARGNRNFGFHGAWKIDDNNVQNKAARDAQILISSTRCVDALRFFHGEIKSVFARRIDNIISFNLEFASGVLGAIVMSANCESQFHCTTSNGFLSWRDDEVVLRQNHQTHRNEYSNGAQTAHKNELRAWLQSVESGRRTLAKSHNIDAIINLRVALAIAQSAKSGKAVRLNT